jgi:Ca2+-binding RTX toxin-like protein
MTVYNLGNGADSFDSSEAADWTNGSVVNGGNGGDRILASGSNIVLDSGNGGDVIIATGHGNELYGGQGRDQLEIRGEGSVVTGGSGVDSFFFTSNIHLFVTNDIGSHDDYLSEGDNLTGDFDVFDVLADYQAGELLRFGGTTNIGVVPLDAYRAGHQHLTLQLGEYGSVRGNLIDNSQFVVSSTGADLLFVYNSVEGINEQWYYGALVLSGVTDASSVLIG